MWHQLVSNGLSMEGKSRSSMSWKRETVPICTTVQKDPSADCYSGCTVNSPEELQTCYKRHGIKQCKSEYSW